MNGGRTRTIDVDDLDVRATLGTIGIYRNDPTHEWFPNGFGKAVLTPDGPGAIHVDWSAGSTVAAEAWGDGAQWLLDQLPLWLGEADDVSDFDPTGHPKINQLWKRHRNVRLCRSGFIWQDLALTLLGQRVTTEEASKSWNRMCRTWGEPAPGPDGLTLPPDPSVVAKLNYTDLHGLNVERRRADAMILAAKRANRLEEAAAMSVDDALVRLSALPGLGSWTATVVTTISHGAPDVVVLRDYGMPTIVNYFFTGDAKRLPPDHGGDEIMLNHLAPWAGHRQRVMRLIMASGNGPPRRAPRAQNPDIRRM